MNHRLATVLGLLLLASGTLFLAYAALSLRHMPVEPIRPPAPALAPSAVTPEGGPSGPGEGLRPETAQSGAMPAGVRPEGAMPAPQAWATPASSPPVSPIAALSPRHPLDPSDSTDRTAARRQAAIMWLLIALPLVFITFVLMILLRRLRPPPMKHTGPSDTTDLWQEAGRRMK
jgi:hypothetical protein